MPIEQICREKPCRSNEYAVKNVKFRECYFGLEFGPNSLLAACFTVHCPLAAMGKTKGTTANSEMKQKIAELKVSLNGKMPTKEQLQEHLGISENIAEFVLQKLFLESPSRAEASATSATSASDAPPDSAVDGKSAAKAKASTPKAKAKARAAEVPCGEVGSEDEDGQMSVVASPPPEPASAAVAEKPQPPKKVAEKPQPPKVVNEEPATAASARTPTTPVCGPQLLK